MTGKKWFAVLLLLVFLVGAGVGLLWAGFIGLEGVGARAPRGRGREAYHQWLARHLALSDEQQLRVERVLEEHRERFEELRRSLEPDLERLREEMRGQMRAILTEEQWEKFERLEAEARQRRARRGERGRPGEPAPDKPPVEQQEQP